MPKEPSDLHHVHAMVPRDLFAKFRKHFPNKGDVQRGIILAIEALLQLLENEEDDT